MTPSLGGDLGPGRRRNLLYGALGCPVQRHRSKWKTAGEHCQANLQERRQPNGLVSVAAKRTEKHSMRGLSERSLG